MKTLTQIQTEAREKVATILMPLLDEIFNGENRTSKKIHVELDKTLDSLTGLISTAYQLGKDASKEESEKVLDVIADGIRDFSKEIREQTELIKQARSV